MSLTWPVIWTFCIFAGDPAFVDRWFRLGIQPQDGETASARRRSGAKVRSLSPAGIWGPKAEMPALPSAFGGDWSS